jgi:hypothetical protein
MWVSKLYFFSQLVLFLLSTFVQIPGLARPCISNLAAAGSSSQIGRDTMVPGDKIKILKG